MDIAPTDTTHEGTPNSEPDVSPPHEEDHLQRAGDSRMLAGVAAGLAHYFDIDPTLVRVGFVALTLLGGLAVPLYLAGWLLIPAEGADLSVAEELLAHERAR
jgi:phage shock protein PspC (stress-responsive transcriptional regulator)